MNKFAAWLKKLFSADAEASSSRVIQFIAVVGTLALMWGSTVRQWTVSDNIRMVLVTMLMGCFGAYAFSKSKEDRDAR